MDERTRFFRRMDEWTKIFETDERKLTAFPAPRLIINALRKSFCTYTCTYTCTSDFCYGMGLPLFGTLCTAIWYEPYHYLVRIVPNIWTIFGTMVNFG